VHDEITKAINDELGRDFPGGRLTHEPILPMKHAQINGGARDMPVLDLARRKLSEAIEHIDAAQRLLSETGGQL
jgi:hypothetical protein